MTLFSVVALLLYVSGLGVRVADHEDQCLAGYANNVIIGEVIIDKSLAEWCHSHPTECRDGAIKPERQKPRLSESDFRGGLYIDSELEHRSREINGWLGLTDTKVSKIALFHEIDHTILWSHEMWTRDKIDISKVLDSPDAQSEHRLLVEWERPAWFATTGAWDPMHPGFIIAWTPASIEGEPGGKLLIGDETSSISYDGLIPKDISPLVHRYVGNNVKDRTAILKKFGIAVYHAAGVLTWVDSNGEDPGFVTVVELQWVNQLAIAAGKNQYPWYAEAQGELWDAIKRQHPFMHAPALPEYSELNVWDVHMDAATFRTFFKEDGVRQKRWEHPHMSKPVQVKTPINRGQLMESLRRYVRNKPQYTYPSDNCQTFMIDLVRYLNRDAEMDVFGIGTGDWDPIAKLFRRFAMSYRPRPDFFDMLNTFQSKM